MKTIGIVLAIIFGTVQMYASELIITSNTPKSFSIQIAGNTYQSYNGEVSIQNLAPGSYRMSVISKINGHTSHAPTKISYQNIQIPAQSRIFAKIFPSNIVTISYIEHKQAPKAYVASCPRIEERNEYSYHKQEANYERAMSPSRFEDLYLYLSELRYDTERAKATKYAINENKFTAAQAYDLVNLFNFEDIRLEIAKLAYDKTIDQNNYYKVFELLSFDSSKSELDNYINYPKYNQQNSYSYSYHEH